MRFRSETIIVPITISKTGRLTFPISGYQRYGFSCTSQTSLSRNSPVSFIPHYYWNPFTLQISNRFVSNLHPAATSWTNGCLWTVPPFWKYWRHQQNRRVARTQWAALTDMVLFRTLSTNHEEIGRRNVIPEGLCQGFTRGTMKTQDRWCIMPVSRWSMTIGPTRYVLCTTRIAYHHLTPSTCTCSPDRYDHQLLYGTRHQQTIMTNCHCWWRNNHPTNHLDIVIGTTIQEKKRNSMTDKQLCSMQKARNSKSGIFGIRKGVMLRFCYVSHLIITDYFFIST